MPKYLSQVVAQRPDIQKRTSRLLTDAHHALLVPALLEGNSGQYEPKVDGGEELPEEFKAVTVTVREMVKQTREALVDLFNITAARDFTNGPGIGLDGGAVADVVVDGTVLVTDAPVPYLLWLERQLDDIRTFVDKLPTQDPGITWELYEDRGVYRSAAEVKIRQVNVPKTHVLFEPTEHQPGQGQVYQETVGVGRWTRHKFTGAVPVNEKRELQRRVAALRAAVQDARERANRVEAKDPRPGDTLLGFLFDGVW